MARAEILDHAMLLILLKLVRHKWMRFLWMVGCKLSIPLKGGTDYSWCGGFRRSRICRSSSYSDGTGSSKDSG